MDTLLADVRFAVRTLLKSPGFTLVAVVTLALGIGANTAIFSVVNRLLFHPMPFLSESDRNVAVWAGSPRGNDHNEASPADFRDWRDQAKSFDHLVMHVWWTANLTGGAQPERLQGFQVSPDYFDALGLRPALGRGFKAGDDDPARERVAVLSWGLFTRRFGGDTTVIGRIISINGVPRTVVGVMPPGVRYPVPAQLWAPFVTTAETWASRRSHYLLVTGHLAPGATLGSARAEMAAIARRLAEQYPATNKDWTINVQPLVPDQTRAIQPLLLVLFAAVGLVLLIACANVANLLLARGTGRRRELAIRAALGAVRGRLARLLLVESFVLAAAGGAFGILLGVWGLDLLKSLVPQDQTQFVAGFERLRVDGSVLAFTASLAIATALLVGLMPALRMSAGDLQDSLKDGQPGSGHRSHRARRLLVGAEVALAMLLLVGAGLVVRTFEHLGTVDPGFNGDRVALTSLVLPYRSYANDTTVAGFYRPLIARVAALPGVEVAAAANVVPLCGCNQTSGFSIVGAAPYPPGEGPEFNWRVVTPGYFSALRIPMRAGRGFTEADELSAPSVAIVNETLARRWFTDGRVLGRQLFVDGDTIRKVEIVGIVADIRHSGLGQPADPEMYLPAAQRPDNAMTIIARTAGDPSGLMPSLRAAVSALDKDQPVYDQRTMRDVIDLSIAQYRFAMRLLGALAALALALAGIGIYAVIAHLVTERTREIGIRIALGGDPGSVRALVVRQGLGPAAFGLLGGAIGSLALAGLLDKLLVGVSPRDPLTLIGVSVLLFVVALAACWIPALRATRVDPMVALRNE